MIALVLLLALTAVAAVTDVVWQKIHNATTYTGIVAALLLSGVRSVLETGQLAGASHLDRWSWIGLSSSLAGLAACAAAMLVCFVLFRIGGGDVKLIAMMGAFLGLEKGLEAMLWTFVFGGCLGLLVLIWRVGAITLLVRAGKYLLSILKTGSLQRPDKPDRDVLRSRLYLGPCALLAAVVVSIDLVRYLPALV